MNIKIPEQIQKYLTDKLNEQRIGIIKFVFIKEVIAPLVNRSDDPEDVITFRLPDGREIVAINSRKLKSKDKLFGLQIARNHGGTLNEKNIDDFLERYKFKSSDHNKYKGYEAKYNEMNALGFLANINSIAFGDTAVADNAMGLKARCYYDWAYSVRDQGQVTFPLQHNALSESGTMFDTQGDRKGRQRQSLFTTKYIMPNTYFPHSITLTDSTPEIFIHTLFAILQSKAYGAQTTVQGSITMKNHLVAIVAAKYEQPINSLTISQSFSRDNLDDLNIKKVKETLINQLNKRYDSNEIMKEEDMKELLSCTNEMYAETDKLEDFYEKIRKDCEDFFVEVGYLQKK